MIGTIAAVAVVALLAFLWMRAIDGQIDREKERKEHAAKAERIREAKAQLEEFNARRWSPDPWPKPRHFIVAATARAGHLLAERYDLPRRSFVLVNSMRSIEGIEPFRPGDTFSYAYDSGDLSDYQFYGINNQFERLCVLGGYSPGDLEHAFMESERSRPYLMYRDSEHDYLERAVKQNSWNPI